MASAAPEEGERAEVPGVGSSSGAAWGGGGAGGRLLFSLLCHWEREGRRRENPRRALVLG